MIIVINNIPGLLESPDKLRAFNNILMSFGEGKHVLWMPSKKIEEIISQKIISGYNQQVLYELKERSRLTKSLRDDFDFYVDVDFEADNEYFLVDSKKLTVGYVHFIDSSSVQLPVFIAENLSDINFYELGSKVYLKEHKLLSQYDIKFRKVSGGGNTTINSFELHCQQKDLLLCILDSDKKHPSQGVKDTAARFSDYPVGWGDRYWLHILDHTEAENIVPWRIADRALGSISASTQEQFRGLSPGLRRYLDHKEGMRVGEALSMDDRHNSNYWRGILPAGKQPEEWICEPMGQRFLDKCLALMGEMSVHKLSEEIDRDRDTEYMCIARMVASWGIGLKSAIR